MAIKIKKKIAGDFIYTFSALLLVNIVLQIVIYPLINKHYSSSTLGDIVYYSGIIYTISASVGGAISNQKLLLRRKYEKTNGDFNIIVLAVSAIIFVSLLSVSFFSNLGVVDAILYGASGSLVFLRYFAEVEFRLTQYFKGYLYYYILVSIGYLLGFLLYRVTGLWYFIFIVGEAMALIYVLVKGNIFKPEELTGDLKKIIKLVVILTASYLLGAFAVRYYKIFIKLYMGGTAVTVYYVGSFFGKSLDLVITPITTLMVSYLTTKKGEEIKYSLKKMIGISALVGVILYVAFIVATPIYCHILYPNIYSDVMSINYIVNIAQSFSVISSILIVFILVKYGTKSHFAVQLAFVIVYTLASSLLSIRFGLVGFAIGASIGFAFKTLMVLVVAIRKEKQNA